MIYIVPIEPLEERYSSQWRTWFSKFFESKDVDHEFIDGVPLTYTIEQGAFLDVCGTNYYKASQLMQIAKLIHAGKVHNTGNVFLFMDLWFPGLEMLAYMRSALGLSFKITGMLHAGTYDPNDFLTKHNMEIWGKPLEESWFTFVDDIFVATNYHKFLLKKRRQCFPDKIHVTGFPIYPDFVDSKCEKENIVVFPHRLDVEKRPDVFDRLEKRLKDIHPDWKFMKSKETCTNKKEYYTLLNRSKIAVSCASQETWGIAMQEALFCGCIPIVPDYLSYPEMYPDSLRYFSFDLGPDSLVSLVDWAIRNYGTIWSTIACKTKFELISKGQNALESILFHLLK